MSRFHAGYDLEPCYQAAVIRPSLQFSDDEETVFYHEPSGSMFLLHNWGIKALECLAHGPLSASRLYQQLKGERDIPDYPAFQQFLSQSVSAGLIDQI